MDGTKMGQLTAMLMEALDRDFPEAEIGDVVLVAEVCMPDGTSNYVHISTANGRPHVARGLLAHILAKN